MSQIHGQASVATPGHSKGDQATVVARIFRRWSSRRLISTAAPTAGREAQRVRAAARLGQQGQAAAASSLCWRQHCKVWLLITPGRITSGRLNTRLGFVGNEGRCTGEVAGPLLLPGTALGVTCSVRCYC